MTAPLKTVEQTCVFCGNTTRVEIMTIDALESYIRWQNGDAPEVAFATWTPAQRNALTAGLHAECLDLYRPMVEEPDD